MPECVLLLVDDDLEDQLIFLEILKSLNLPINCQTARDGIFALELINSPGFRIPDIIFLDYNMPRMNGQELLNVIRDQAAFQHVPIIMYSTASMPAYINQCLALGATTYMIKPSSFQQFRQELLQLLLMHVPALKQAP